MNLEFFDRKERVLAAKIIAYAHAQAGKNQDEVCAKIEQFICSRGLGEKAASVRSALRLLGLPEGDFFADSLLKNLAYEDFFNDGARDYKLLLAASEAYYERVKTIGLSNDKGDEDDDYDDDDDDDEYTADNYGLIKKRQKIWLNEIVPGVVADRMISWFSPFDQNYNDQEAFDKFRDEFNLPKELGAISHHQAEFYALIEAQTADIDASAVLKQLKYFLDLA